MFCKSRVPQLRKSQTEEVRLISESTDSSKFVMP